MTDDDEKVSFGLPVQDRKALRKDPDFQAEIRQAKKDAEVEDIEAFLASYPRATDQDLEIDEIAESPDAICLRDDGSQIGLEITSVRRSPDQAFWESTLDHKDEMDLQEAADEIWRLVEQKARLRPNFSTPSTILVLAICEADFRAVVNYISEVPIKDWAAAGFEEIWLADFKGIREGAHREVRLFGLFPEKYRKVIGRSDYDQKPYG